MFFPEAFPELFQISRWKIQTNLDFHSFLLRQTDFFGQILPFSLGATIMFQFHMQVQGDIWSIWSQASLEGTLISLLDHIRSSSYFFLAFLSPNSHPIFLSIFQLMNIFNKDLIAIRIFFDFSDHDLVKKIDFPKLLIIAILFIIFWVN